MKAIISTYYLKMKFSNENGIEVVCGDQYDLRQCYVLAPRLKSVAMETL